MKKTISLIIVLAFVFNFWGMLSNSTMVFADSGVTVETISSFRGSNLYNFAYNSKDTYVAVGKGEYAKVSKDGIKWDTVSLDAYYNINSVIWNEGKFVAVGANNILTSGNGKSWTKTVSFDTYVLDSVVYAGGKFFSYGYDYMLVSEDGEKWQEIELLDEDYNFYSADNIFWNGNKYYCYASGEVLSSEDGISWALVDNDKSYDTWGAGIFNNKVYSTVTEGYDGKSSSFSLQATSDGEKWSKVGPTFEGSSHEMEYGYNKYALLATILYKDGNVIYTSTNGRAWSSFSFDVSIEDIAVNSKRYVAVGENGYIASSADGRRWTKANIKSTNHFYKVIWNGSSFIAVGSYEVYYSTDGLKWNKLTDINPQNTYFYNTRLDKIGDKTFISYNDTIITIDSKNKMYTYDEISESFYYIDKFDNQYLAVGEKNIATSANGYNWKYNTTDLDVYSSISDVVLIDNMYFGIGERREDDDIKSMMVYSENGDDWYTTLAEDYYGLISIAEGASGVAMTSFLGIIMYALDAIDWKVVHESDSILTKIEYLNDKFIALGLTDSIEVSTDGINWTTSFIKEDAFFIDAIWTGEEYRVYGYVNDDFVVFRSKNLKNWIEQKSTSIVKDNSKTDSNFINDVYYDNGKYIAVGSHIFVSKDGIKWDAYGTGVNASLNSMVKADNGYIAAGENGTIIRFSINQ